MTEQRHVLSRAISVPFMCLQLMSLLSEAMCVHGREPAYANFCSYTLWHLSHGDKKSSAGMLARGRARALCQAPSTLA